MSRKQANSKRKSSGESRALEKLPAPILKKLHALVRRVRRVQIFRGIFATLAALAIAIIVIMAVGATFTILSSKIHAALTATGIAAVLVTAYRTLVVPLRRELSLPHIARVIETRHPELQERLSTAIGLLGSDDPEAIRGSEQLLDEVVKSAVADAKTMRPEREFTTRTARRYIRASAVAAGLLLLALLLFPGGSGRLLKRVVAPFSKVGNAYAHHLQVEPGSVLVPDGDPVTIKVVVDDPDAIRAEIRRSSGSSSETVESMTLLRRDEQAGTSEFAITFPAVNEDFRYRIRSGRAVSAFHEVTAATRPGIRRLEVIYFYPEYTKLGQSTVVGTTQEIAAVAGTKVQIFANFDRVLDSAVFKIDGNLIPATQDQTGDAQNPRASWNFEMIEGTEGYWKLALTDTENIPNRTEEIQIRALPDQVPSLRLLGGQTDLRVRPDERLILRYEVEEDFGIAAARIRIVSPESTIPQPLPSQKSLGNFAGKAVLDLSQLALPDSKTFQFFLEVEDVHPSRQSAKAGPITVTIDSGADSLAEQFVDQQRASMHAALSEAIAKLQEAKTISIPVPQQLIKPDIILLETLQQLAKIQTLTGEAEHLVRDTATAAAAPSSLFKMLSPALVSTADDHLVPARQAAEEIPLSDEQRTRVHRANRVTRQLEEGIADLNVAIRELKQQTARARLLAQMSDLGEKQRQLAEDIAAASDPATQEKLREQQEQLAAEMGKLAEESKRSVADQLQDIRQDAAELAAQARDLAAEQAQLAKLLDSAEDPGAREEANDDMIRALEAEQREIGDDTATLEKIAADNAPDPTLLAELAEAQTNAFTAADALLENRLSASATIGAANALALEQLEKSVDQATVRNELERLAAWQDSVARQIDALARQRLDEALAARQEALAEAAEALAHNADDLRQDAESLADPSALQQVQQASNEATMAAQSARQASSQLGGETSTGAFDFARSPDQLPSQQNRNPNAPPRPTQAGVTDPAATTQFNVDAPPPGDDQLPDMSTIEGTRENPFSVGEVAIDTLPPALEDGSMTITGGRLPPGGARPPSTAPRPTPSPGAASGQKSIASAAQQPAMQAQHGLANAASALSNAAGSLGQQANSPSAQQQPQINQQMLRAARQAAELAAEKNPELAAKLAEAIATSLTQAPVQDSPTPEVEDWQDIRGKVKSGLASNAKTRTLDEYRDLVKNYFKEIAGRSSEEQE